jgi:hypothetical protein
MKRDYTPYDSFREFWSHDWALNSVRKVQPSYPPDSPAPTQGGRDD